MYPAHFLTQPVTVSQSRGGGSSAPKAPIPPPPSWDSSISAADITYSSLNRNATKKVAAGDGAQTVVLSETTHDSLAGGQWYAEITINKATFHLISFGVAQTGVALNAEIGTDAAGKGWGWQNNMAQAQHFGGASVAYGATQNDGVVIGLKLDLIAFTLELLANNVTFGAAPVPLQGISGVLHVAGSITFGSQSDSLIIATQPGDLTFAVPAGYTAWG